MWRRQLVTGAWIRRRNKKSKETSRFLAHLNNHNLIKFMNTVLHNLEMSFNSSAQENVAYIPITSPELPVLRNHFTVLTLLNVIS
jgi:hypothetical protein